VLAGPGDAAARYRQFLHSTYAPYASITAAAHAAVLTKPRTIAAVGRLVTAPGIGRAAAGGWSIFWNDLLDGARPGPPRTVASTATRLGRIVTARTRARAWFSAEFDSVGRPEPPVCWAR
jgi:hypothetical protein